MAAEITPTRSGPERRAAGAPPGAEAACATWLF
jgi:hypothetical protein